MRHTYDENTFEDLYSDVNELYYVRDYAFYTPAKASYDTFTGMSDDCYFDWN